MSAPRTAPYRLVVFDPIIDPEPVRDLICRTTGLHPTDANQWIARMPGIPVRPLSEDEVRPLLDGLFELGIAAEARLVDTIPSLTPARTVHAFSCEDGGFRVLGLRGEPIQWIPWDRVEVIDGGLVEQADEVRAVARPGWVRAVGDGLNAVLRRPGKLAQRERSLHFERAPLPELILVRRDPLLAFRLPSHDLNYKYLGDRLRPSAGENFPILLADLRRYAGAAFSPEATALADDQETSRFPSSQALLDHALLRLLRVWYRRDRESAGEGGPSEDRPL